MSEPKHNSTTSETIPPRRPLKRDLLRRQPRWALIMALWRDRKIMIAPRELVAAVQRFHADPGEQAIINNLRTDMAALRTARKARRGMGDPLIGDSSPKRLARRHAAAFGAHIVAIREAVWSATCDWSSRRTVVQTGPAAVWYEQIVEWAHSGWCRRHHKPEAVYDILHVQVPLGIVPRFDRDGERCREITIGAWTWRKLVGHSLAVRYQSQGAEADRAAFAATANSELRAAIAVASGDHVEALLEARLLQADDYGRVYQTAVGRMVRVVCPSTGRTHWLRADPHAETAHAAVAASFGMTVVDYAPQEQH